MDKIHDKIYLGALEDIFKTEAMKEAGISHILSIIDKDLPVSVQNGFTCKFVEVLDLPDEDLLTHFQDCLRFIDEARNSGTGIFVHCLAGCSRSATIVVAWIMREKNLSVEEALYLVKECRSMIRPNEGFHFQLELFSQMKCRVDSQNSIYKKYKLNALALQMQQGYSSPEEILSTVLAANPTEIQTRKETTYRCKKCRQYLFREASVLSHTIGEGEDAFSWRAKMSYAWEAKSEEICTASLFIEPVQWMSGIVKEQEGKLFCPKCKTKLGSFIWCGENCPCGAWVAPAFHINKRNVDLQKPIVLNPRSMGVAPTREPMPMVTP